MNKELLENLLKTCSPSGYEKEALDVFNNYCSEFSKNLFSDKMGNSAFYIGNDVNNPIMISAHIDEVGYQVQYITEEGMLNIVPIGGPDKKVLLGSEVLVKGSIPGIIGKKPIHVEDSEERDNLELKLVDCLVDIGAESKEDAEKLVEVGDWITFTPNYKLLGANKVMSKGLDDKAGMYVVMSAFEELAKDEYETIENVVAVANTQEEEGLRGAKVTSRNINPRISIDIDVTFATDEGRGIEKGSHGDVKLGYGPVIVFGPDKSNRLISIVKKIAKENYIPLQFSSSYSGGTNTTAIQEHSLNCETLHIAIPNRNMHTQVEVCDLRDLENSVKLLVLLVKELSKEL